MISPKKEKFWLKKDISNVLLSSAKVNFLNFEQVFGNELFAIKAKKEVIINHLGSTIRFMAVMVNLKEQLVFSLMVSIKISSWQAVKHEGMRQENGEFKIKSYIHDGISSPLSP